MTSCALPSLKSAQYPVMEFLWKRGYTNIVDDVCTFGLRRDDLKAINLKGKTLNQCFKIPISWFKDYDPKELSTSKLADIITLYKKGVAREEIKEFLNYASCFGDIEANIFKYASSSIRL